MSFTSQQLEDLERKAIDDAHAEAVSQAFAVLCDAIATNTEQRFAEALTNARRAREIALSACGITPRNP